ALQRGDVVLLGRPLLAQQIGSNRGEAVGCPGCHRWCSTLEQQLMSISGVSRMELFPADGYGAAIADDAAKLPPLPGMPASPSPCACGAGCGEVYCSSSCRSRCWDADHSLLCVGKVGDMAHPLYAFKLHAVESNDLFVMAAQVVIRAIRLAQEHVSSGG
ncbi:unnamed protein product, partial [Phaeothamnion confervicola]